MIQLVYRIIRRRGMALKHVPGKSAGKVVLYGLSTCPWCKKTKELLNSMGVDYYYDDVDLMSDNEKEKAMEVVRKWNPGHNFPTIVINDSKCIVGYLESEIKKQLKV
jgi:glutaredoxin-like protein NrdH